MNNLIVGVSHIDNLVKVKGANYAQVNIKLKFLEVGHSFHDFIDQGKDGDAWAFDLITLF